ncbi:hypothetical protein TSUD_278980 [Trifolium subterraneum]|uniref:Uncharacterized protein n=1 Tax=Trifolium subterraneum TaxID=3900 RepID=A0A2Z6N026_TRISU|nr:hypothetical protein TSUD_278980 [Trifolium subterraneum]
MKNNEHESGPTATMDLNAFSGSAMSTYIGDHGAIRLTYGLCGLKRMDRMSCGVGLRICGSAYHSRSLHFIFW